VKGSTGTETNKLKETKMKKQIVSIVTVLGLAVAVSSPAIAGDLETLSGKWSVQKTNEDGQRFSQVIEIKKDKFTFKVLGADGETRLYAEGDVKLDKAGPFKTVIFSNIKAGQSSDDSSPIEDTYTSIYKMGDDGSWLVVMNFDKDRDEQQKPALDAYRKVKQAQK
jgi:hypothetical protein